MDLMALENLERYYGELLALQVPEVRMPVGAVGLLGPNGAGKSTLIRVLMGLLRPTAGSARLLGLDVVTDSTAVRSLVGYVSEEECLVPGLSAVEFVALGGELVGMRARDAHRRAHEVLSYLGVEESRYRRVEDLSTGVKQRVRVAQALVHDPRVLILDEPTNGLDPGGRRAMLALIRSMHRDFGKSVVLSSHLLQDVDSVCDSVIIMEQGRILAHGRIDMLRAGLRNRYRMRLEGEVGRYVERLRGAGVTVQLGSRPGVEGTELDLELPAGFSPRGVLQVLRETIDEEPSGPVPQVRGFAPREESLQDVFRRITRTGEVGFAR
jgi:ABC-2 type transport system ATP-binding protein